MPLLRKIAPLLFHFKVDFTCKFLLATAGEACTDNFIFLVYSLSCDVSSYHRLFISQQSCEQNEQLLNSQRRQESFRAQQFLCVAFFHYAEDYRRNTDELVKF